MQTKKDQEETITEYKKKHFENEEAIKDLTKSLEQSNEKLQSAEQVSHDCRNCI